MTWYGWQQVSGGYTLHYRVSWVHRQFRLSDGWNDRLFGGDLNLRSRNEGISIGQLKTLVRIRRN